MNYTTQERLEIVLDLVKKLKEYKTDKGIETDLYKDSYTYVPIFKKLSNEYIKTGIEVKGTLTFEEIGDKKINYLLPVTKGTKAVFHIKMQ